MGLPKKRARHDKIESKKPRAGLIISTLAGIALLAMAVWLWYLRSHRDQPAAAATYVGEAGCAQCHAAEAAAWRTSHHAAAMQVANNSPYWAISTAHISRRKMRAPTSTRRTTSSTFVLPVQT